MIGHGYLKTYPPSSQHSVVAKVNIALSGTSSISTSVINMKMMAGYIDQVTSLELMGYAYTVENTAGLTIDLINTATYASLSSAYSYGIGTWKLLQARVNNHMHRPIYAVN